MTADNLKDAYRRVRQQYGEDAVILGTRTVTRRHQSGLGHDKLVEVTVQTGRTRSAATLAGRGAIRPAAQRAPEAFGQGELAGAIMQEIERIEGLVEELSARQEALAGQAKPGLDSDLAQRLARAGARPATVAKLLQRYHGEEPGRDGGQDAVIAWLTKQLKAGNCGWNGFYGCHAFLGHPGSERTELVLETAARFQELGRNTLVLMMFPEHAGQIRRLQTEAARQGYDAAILQKESQLARLQDHLGNYDVVLVDLPDPDGEEMRTDGPLHRWLAANATFHRHLVQGLDCDLDEIEPVAGLARHWNCDWVAVTRTRRTRRKGKLLDILENLPLPVSLVLDFENGRREPRIAQSGELVRDILAAGEELAMEAAEARALK